MAGGERIHLRITYSKLADLFNCKIPTVKRWVYLGLLDPTSLADIVEKYNNPAMLDKRRKQTE